MASLPLLTDQQFITQFEALSLNPEYFDHLGHLRLAWLYLLDNDLETAVDKICAGIKRYAGSLGASNKFHYTMTDGIVRIEHQRMKLLQRQLGVNGLNSGHWQEFIGANNDLICDAKAVLGQYYSSGLLASELARTAILAPDLRSI